MNCIVSKVAISIGYWPGVMQPRFKPIYKRINQASTFPDHTNYRWRLGNPYNSFLDNIYVEVPFSRVLTTTGENPILIPDGNDPYKKIFIRKPTPKPDLHKNETRDNPSFWSSLKTTIKDTAGFAMEIGKHVMGEFTKG